MYLIWLLWVTSILQYRILLVEAYIGESLDDPASLACSNQEIFSFHHMKCVLCDTKLNLVPSDTKDACVCDKDSVHTGWNKTVPRCFKCVSGTVANSDNTGCIRKLECGPNQIELDRSPEGLLFTESLCISCPNSSIPALTRCVRPGLNLTYITSGLLDQWPDVSDTYRVNYETLPPVTSRLLETQLRRSLYYCVTLKRYSHCDSVANLCVLMLYKDSGPCILFRNHHHIPWSSPSEGALPWLYYGEGDAITVLTRKKIPTRYSVKRTSELNWLNLTGIKYSLSYPTESAPDSQEQSLVSTIQLVNITGSDLQLCYGDKSALNNALRFGTFYRRQCKLYVKDLQSTTTTTDVFELFLSFPDENNKPTLYTIPVLINTNLKTDMSSWQLVRRFFLIDTLLGIPSTTSSTKPGSGEVNVIRYVKSAVLRINVQKSLEEEGKIFVPLLVLYYGEVDTVSGPETIETSFSVEYYMHTDMEHFIDVACILLSCLVIVWSGIQTWSRSRRNDSATIDLFTLAEMALILSGHLANVLYTVAAGVTLYMFLVYKCQDVMYRLLGTPSLRSTLYMNVFIAFLLKSVEIVRLVYKQISVDIFFIDWERPRPSNTTQQPVSIWRTYFIANEWNEIQSKRKTSTLIQILTTLYLIKIAGFEHLALAQPELNTRVADDMVYIPEDPLLKLGVSVCTYVLVYLTQWLLLIGVYENFIKNGIHQFVDLCSVANVSVFILTMENYGFYIHGRSAHGFADTDMESMATQMLREEEDLVGHRGLLPGTEQQTFEMSVPRQLRSYYKRVMAPLSMSQHPNSQAGAGSMTAALKMKSLMGGGGGGGVDINRSVQAYNNMNRFLAAFLEHALKDLDYHVKDKMFVEALLDIEFSDAAADKGVFYIDNGHSFDSVLFYGAEFSLFSFELMLFTSVLIWFDNSLTAGLVTIFVAKIIAYIRDLGGKSNLAKKTLIDERFLI
uniref:Meckelin n=1 Tax=Cacopsylla melanoneura TaxID=428564 RepID=A0A8D8X0C7_9HEMI